MYSFCQKYQNMLRIYKQNYISCGNDRIWITLPSCWDYRALKFVHMLYYSESFPCSCFSSETDFCIICCLPPVCYLRHILHSYTDVMVKLISTGFLSCCYTCSALLSSKQCNYDLLYDCEVLSWNYESYQGVKVLDL